MKVKIGNQIYDSENQPIMLILSESDKMNLRNMPADAKKFCSAPDSYSKNELKNFMTEDTDRYNVVLSRKYISIDTIVEYGVPSETADQLVKLYNQNTQAGNTFYKIKTP